MHCVFESVVTNDASFTETLKVESAGEWVSVSLAIQEGDANPDEVVLNLDRGQAQELHRMLHLIEWEHDGDE